MIEQPRQSEPSGQDRLARRGITLVEVLVSIVVAAIGLFGVLILIPFAVRNAQIAMDQESAMTAAQNGLADFEAWGYHEHFRWYNPLPNPPPPDPTAPNPTCPAGRAFCIDPLGLGGRTEPVGEWNVFPLYDPILAPPLASLSGLPFIERLNLLDSTGNPFSEALARRIAMAADDLAYAIPDQDFEPPQPLFFSLGNPVVPNAKRQSTGQFSWMAFVVPEDFVRNRYRVYFVVFSRRNLGQYDNVYQVVEPIPEESTSGHPIAYGGGDVALNRVSAAAPLGDIRRNDFVVLLNQFGNSVQFEIFRVAEVYPQDPGPPPVDYRLTLQGGDFDFIPDNNTLLGDPEPEPEPDPDDTTVITYAVHLPNVIAVYSRTIRLQTNSNYSLSP